MASSSSVGELTALRRPKKHPANLFCSEGTLYFLHGKQSSGHQNKNCLAAAAVRVEAGAFMV
jgi:hypothetical protein